MQKQYKALFILALMLAQNLSGFAQDSTGAETNDQFTAEEQEVFAKNTESFEFQAEIGRLMDIIINSLYTNKEIFLREIISNASDALDKIRFLAVSDPSILQNLSELAIRIEFDTEEKTISIYDSGIGMTKQDLINKLGTIAKSGTTDFVEALTRENSLNLIGQFGVGFYSSFLAGNKVTVITKNNGDDQHIWESSAASQFSITKDPRGNTLERGTKIIIHLKQDAYEFCEQDKLKSLIKKYSEFINFPIYLKTEKEVSKEVPDEDAIEEEKKKEEEADEKRDDDLEVKEGEEEEKPPKMKTIKEKVWDWELINDSKALWLRNKEEIEEEEYNKFYKSLAKDHEDPLTHIHFNAEGEVDFKAILFIPKSAPHDMFDNYYAKSSNLKLYVRRVLIGEAFDELVPRYLNFIKGVIDSDDLPINVSRESLQQLKMIKVIGRKVARKSLEMIKKLAEAKDTDEEEDEEEYEEEEEQRATEEQQEQKEEQAEEGEKQEGEEDEDEEALREKKRKERLEKYETFWKEFGKNIKLGVIEDATNRNKLAGLTRWYSSKDSKEWTSLDDYIDRMKENQDSIYYIGGESKDALLKYPTIQALLRKGYEVLLLDDPIDEYTMQNLNEYEKKKLVNVAKGDFRMPTDDETEKKKLKKLKKMYEPLTEWWKNQLKEDLDSVTVSERLVDDPVVVVASGFGSSAYMERIQKAQAYGQRDHPSMSAKRTLEINPHHPVIKELLERVKEQEAGTDDKETIDMATLLYNAAALNSGYTLKDPHEFSAKFFKIFNGALGIPKDAKVEEIEVDLDEEEEAAPESAPEGEEVNIDDLKMEDLPVDADL